ncbi:antiviral reverse transcriptase Drt3a [Synechococcus sp. CCY 9618]|uniref:antiviral reverse transcriptase Drt3a n=1 Tax=Synechococcus sp. CCY 9618 TaxID=2815602 RepID=UPI001C2494F9|nr:antiviral reverse transcriptase Drt3a [Synechococcus sp. CCY 9618]
MTLAGLRAIRDADPRLEAIPIFGTGSIEEAHCRAMGPMWTMQLFRSPRGKFEVYQPLDMLDRLLVSAATATFSKVTRVKQANRHLVNATVANMFSEGIPFVVHRFDLRQFYESIPREQIELRLIDDLGLPRSAVRVMRSLFQGCTEQGVVGLPRGVPSSAVLSEDYLLPIDRALSNHDHIYFYSRYVDDIIVVTSAEAKHLDLKSWLRDQLRTRGGLRLNHEKSHGVLIEGGQANKLPSHIEFLGYRYTITPQKKNKNAVSIDIAPAKIEKVSSRLCLSARAFLIDHDYALFEDRIRALSGNYRIPGGQKGHRPKVGIFYSYPAVSASTYDQGESGLSKLDSFLRALLLGRKTSLSRSLAAALTNGQRRHLARYSFIAGHRTRQLTKFSSQRVGKIVGCWKYA